MDIKTITKNYEPLILDEVVRLSGLLLSDDVFCSIASDEEGVLPHDIANKSIIFIDKKARYKKGDYIVIRDNRVTKSRYRITKALEKKDKDFVGRLMMSIKIY